MYRSSNQLRFVHFDDDTTGFESDSDINNIHATVNRELVEVDNWLKANRLSLKVSKTSYMIIYNQINSFDNIIIRDSIHAKISIVKFFDVSLDENLTLNEHVNKVTTKISQYVDCWCYEETINCQLPADVMLKLYYSLVYSHLIYALLDGEDRNVLSLVRFSVLTGEQANYSQIITKRSSFFTQASDSS